jgi:hypothetical protein
MRKKKKQAKKKKTDAHRATPALTEHSLIEPS